MSDVDNRTHAIIDNYKPKTETKYEDKEGVARVLNIVKNFILDFHLHKETISMLTKKYQSQILDKVLSKYSKHSKSIVEIEYYCTDAIIYPKSDPEETIAKKLN